MKLLRKEEFEKEGRERELELEGSKENRNECVLAG